MSRFRSNWVHLAATLFLLHAMASVAPAAGSISNSLTGFTGVSPDAGVQATLAAAGFEFSSTAGLAEDFSSDPTVSFSASGATFGSLYAGDGGRNYMRTIDNYAFDSYVAEVTVISDTLETDQFWLGMGSGNIALWGTPDFAGVPSLFITAGPGVFQSLGMQGISGDWENPAPCTNNDWCSVEAPSLVGTNAGTHRLRMTLDVDAKMWFGEIDVDYAGGAFVADATTLTYSLVNFYDDGAFVLNGWPTQPSKIYFGGDDGVIFKDFSVTVAGVGQLGDFNGDTVVDAADYTVWRDNLGAADETALGGNGDGMNGVDLADYDLWKANFGVGGAGSGLSAAGVPEPTSFVSAMLGFASLLLTRKGRRAAKRAQSAA